MYISFKMRVPEISRLFGMVLATLLLCAPPPALAATYNSGSYGSGTYGSVAGKIGDINQDGVVNIYDLSLMLVNWKTNYPAADLKVDGTVDVYDLSMLLAHWEG